MPVFRRLYLTWGAVGARLDEPCEPMDVTRREPSHFPATRQRTASK